MSYFHLTTTLLSWAMFLGGVELFLMTRDSSFFRVWNFEALRPDLSHALKLPEKFLGFLFSNRSLKFVSLLQILCALLAFKTPRAEFFIILFFCQLLVSVRFRGTLNGGSDMMTFVVLTGVLIASFWSEKFGFLYVAINGLYSYFKAGLAKLLNEDWRKGRALASFSESFEPWGKILSWPVIIFELSTLAIPVFPGMVWPYFVTAMVFHFLIFRVFGLNRFFWIWLSAWPSIIYLARLQSH